MGYRWQLGGWKPEGQWLEKMIDASGQVQVAFCSSQRLKHLDPEGLTGNTPVSNLTCYHAIILPPPWRITNLSQAGLKAT